MDKKIIISICIVAIYLSLLAFFIMPGHSEYQKTVYGNKDADVTIKIFVSNSVCTPCEEGKARLFNDIFPGNESVLFIELYPVDFSDELKNNLELFYSYLFKGTPGIVILNTSHPEFKNYTTTLSYTEIINTEDKLLEKAVQYHLDANYSKDLNLSDDNYIINTFFGKIDLSDLSIPILTIILGAMDSINPCSFFILLFLLSILLYTKSRKRMILVGGIFIFCSGFIYFLIMIFLLKTFQLTGEQTIINILAGIIGIIFGIINIKDFFFFKKGPSASISENQKPKLYKQMRKIVKITSIPSLIFATIILAISANTVELLCSLNLPVIYTAILNSHSLNTFDNYMYIFFYNLIYIIPLLIITAVVVITLGRKKLSEFQGRMLKLFSGIMIFSLGEILLINSNILSDVLIAIQILLLSLVITFAVYLTSKFLEKPTKND
jgi:hypothetical protein